MARKTIPVVDLKADINARLANPCLPESVHRELCTVLEKALFAAGCYAGYGHVYWLDEGFALWVRDGKPEGDAKQKYFGPEYMRRYY